MLTLPHILSPVLDLYKCAPPLPIAPDIIHAIVLGDSSVQDVEDQLKALPNEGTGVVVVARNPYALPDDLDTPPVLLDAPGLGRVTTKFLQQLRGNPVPSSMSQLGRTSEPGAMLTSAGFISLADRDYLHSIGCFVWCPLNGFRDGVVLQAPQTQLRGLNIGHLQLSVAVGLARLVTDQLLEHGNCPLILPATYNEYTAAIREAVSGVGGALEWLKSERLIRSYEYSGAPLPGHIQVYFQTHGTYAITELDMDITSGLPRFSIWQQGDDNPPGRTRVVDAGNIGLLYTNPEVLRIFNLQSDQLSLDLKL